MWYIQCFFVTCAKPSHRRILSAEIRFENLDLTAQLIAQIFLVLAINSIQFTFDTVLIEQRSFKELCKDTQSFFELIILDIEVKLSEILSGRSILSASIISNKFRVVVLCGIRFSSQEKHVLAEVCEPISLRRVVEVSCPYHQGGSRFLCLLIRHKHALEIVVQEDIPVLSIINTPSLYLLCRKLKVFLIINRLSLTLNINWHYRK